MGVSYGLTHTLTGSHPARPRPRVSAAPHFTDGVNIGYVNHLLFSVSEDPVWGTPVVRPRCLVEVGSD